MLVNACWIPDIIYLIIKLNQKLNYLKLTRTMTPERLQQQTESARSSPRRRRGRPPKLSREGILDTAMAVLATCDTDQFTVTDVAERLGTTSMALYNYFPHREALLNAVADHTFSLFDLPAPGDDADWREELLDWLQALRRHFGQHPVAFKMIGIGGRLPGGWLKVTAPVIRVLRGLGFEGEALAFAATWFTTEAAGLLFAESSAPAHRQAWSLDELDELEPADRESVLCFKEAYQRIDSDRVLTFGFRRLVEGIAELRRNGTAR